MMVLPKNFTHPNLGENLFLIWGDECGANLSIFDMLILTVQNTDKLDIHIFQLLFISNQTIFSSNSAEISQSRKFYCFSTYFNAELTKSDNALFWAF